MCYPTVIKRHISRTALTWIDEALNSGTWIGTSLPNFHDYTPGLYPTLNLSVSSIQWRIQDFPEWGGGTNLLFNQFFFFKLHDHEEILAWVARVSCVPQIHHWYRDDYNRLCTASVLLPFPLLSGHVCARPCAYVQNCVFWRVLVFLLDHKDTCFRSLLLCLNPVWTSLL